MISIEHIKKDEPLYDAVRRTDGLDICDSVYDWGIFVYCEESLDKCNDWYDAFMYVFCVNVICEKQVSDWYSPCRVTEFVKENMKAFKKFFNKENREGYRPKDYENSDDPDVDEGFFEAYLEGMESLLAGNYCDRQYRDLIQLLAGKEKFEKISEIITKKLEKAESK